jgi:hypothetical protein
MKRAASPTPDEPSSKVARVDEYAIVLPSEMWGEIGSAGGAYVARLLSMTSHALGKAVARVDKKLDHSKHCSWYYLAGHRALPLVAQTKNSRVAVEHPDRPNYICLLCDKTMENMLAGAARAGHFANVQKLFPLVRHDRVRALGAAARSRNAEIFDWLRPRILGQQHKYWLQKQLRTGRLDVLDFLADHDNLQPSAFHDPQGLCAAFASESEAVYASPWMPPLTVLVYDTRNAHSLSDRALSTLMRALDWMHRQRPLPASFLQSLCAGPGLNRTSLGNFVCWLVTVRDCFGHVFARDVFSPVLGSTLFTALLHHCSLPAELADLMDHTFPARLDGQTYKVFVMDVARGPCLLAAHDLVEARGGKLELEFDATGPLITATELALLVKRGATMDTGYMAVALKHMDRDLVMALDAHFKAINEPVWEEIGHCYHRAMDREFYAWLITHTDYCLK